MLATRGDMVSLTNLSPDGKKFLISKNDGMPSVQRLGCPHVILGEVAFDHCANRAHDLWVRIECRLRTLLRRRQADRCRCRRRPMPASAIRSGRRTAQSSPTSHISTTPRIFTLRTPTPAPRAGSTVTPVLATLATSFQWSKDGKRIQTVLLPDDGKREMPKREVGSEPKSARDPRRGQSVADLPLPARFALRHETCSSTSPPARWPSSTWPTAV